MSTSLSPWRVRSGTTTGKGTCGWIPEVRPRGTSCHPVSPPDPSPGPRCRLKTSLPCLLTPDPPRSTPHPCRSLGTSSPRVVSGFRRPRPVPSLTVPQGLGTHRRPLPGTGTRDIWGEEGTPTVGEVPGRPGSLSVHRTRVPRDPCRFTPWSHGPADDGGAPAETPASRAPGPSFRGVDGGPGTGSGDSGFTRWT